MQRVHGRSFRALRLKMLKVRWGFKMYEDSVGFKI